MFNFIKTMCGFVAEWFRNKHELTIAQHKTKMNIEENNQRLALSKQNANSAWEIAALKGQDKLVRRVSFFMFAAPFFIATIAPEHVRMYFDVAIMAIPQWWLKTYVSITGTIWGIASLKDILPSIFKGIFNRGN